MVLPTVMSSWTRDQTLLSSHAEDYAVSETGCSWIGAIQRMSIVGVLMPAFEHSIVRYEVRCP